MINRGKSENKAPMKPLKVKAAAQMIIASITKMKPMKAFFRFTFALNPGYSMPQ